MRWMRAVMSLTVLLAGCSHVPKATENGGLKDSWGQLSDKRFIRVRGIGAAPERVSDQVRRRGMARNAALVAARYELLVAIKGVKIEGGLRVAELIEKDSEIRERANRLISGAEVVSTEWTSSDGCVVTVALERAKVEKILRRDEPYEPPTEKQLGGLGLEGRALFGTGRAFTARSAPGETTPAGAFAYGLLFPGGGYLFSRADHMTERQSDRMFYKGVGTMAGVLALAGLGASALSSEPKQTGQRSNGEPETNERDKRALGYVTLGIAGLLHVLAAADSAREVRGSTGLLVTPSRGGATVTVARRF